MNIKDISFLILAGGKSSRMGTEKADLEYGGKTFLNGLIHKANEIGFEEIIISGYRGELYNISIINDELENRGPLGGMYSCFKATKNELCFVVSVDVPQIEKSLITLLLDFHQTHQNPITLLCQGSKIEPLIGVYPTYLYKDIYKIIKDGSAPVFKLLDKFGYSLYHTKSNNIIVSNINTPEDYKQLLLKK